MSRPKADKIRVWVDGQCFQSASRYRGIGRAIFETLSYLARGHNQLDFHLSLNAAHAQEAQTARHVLTPILGADHIHVWEGLVDHPESQTDYGPTQKASEAILAHHVRSLAPDLIWSPSPFEGGHRRFVSPLDPKAIGCPSLVTFHDAIPWRFPERYLADTSSHRCYKRHLDGVGQYDLAMAVSDFAARELRDIHPGQPVITVSSGLSRGFQAIVDQVQSLARNDRDDFELLYVGGIDWRKNVPIILEAMAILKSRGRTAIALRLVGDQPEGDLAQLKRQAETLDVAAQLRFTGFCTDEDLIRAYQSCDVAVQPSIMEGFGLTALEAMRAGAPLIAAKAGALPEVVGDAALLFDPYRADELADHIETLMDDLARMEALRKAGRARCDVFDWNRVASTISSAMINMARPIPPASFNVSALRKKTAASLSRETARAAGHSRLSAHLAASEYRPPCALPRLFIDVTSTLYANHGTGIQRVVTRIADEALKAYPGAQLVICDSDVGLEAAKMDSKGRLTTTRRLSRERIFPRAGDVILLLDSSWTWHKSIEAVMVDARLRGAKVISVMYDLVPIQMPAFCDDGMPIVFSKWMQAALRYSDGFMCISDATATALRGFLEGLSFPRPMPIGAWPLGANIGPASTIGAHDPNHFISVATLEPRKGHADILRAFEALWAAGEDVKLTLIGKPGWGTGALQSKIKRLSEAEPRLTWISDADDTQLRRAYAQAGTLIAASYAEGFGLPIIEARRQGCGVIARNIDVFREVAPAGTRFFEGQSDLVSAILSARNTPPLSDDVPELTDWAQSAGTLIDRVMGGDFAHAYHPGAWDNLTFDTDIGPDRMAGPLFGEDVSVKLEVLPLSLDSPHDGHNRFAVKVTNNGSDVLFSKGRLTGEDCVHLSFLTYDHDNKFRDIEANRSRIPYGLGAGQSTILPIDVPDDIVNNDAIRVEFALVQEGRSWWPFSAVLSRDLFKDHV